MEHSPLDNPLDHSIDNDAFHFPGDVGFNVYQHIGLTKFMLLELVAAVICLLAFLALAANIRRHGYARGKLANMLEAMLLFVRDRIAIPSIGEHDAHRFVPLLWSLFFFILTCNLLGMLPSMGSPTGALGCTVALALCSFLTIHGSGVAKLGAAGYAHAFVPPVPLVLYPLMFAVELLGHLIRPTILAFRLFINMLAGHTVLFVLLAFIYVVGSQGIGFMYWLVTGASVVGVTLLSLLELLVAFLQAYIFTFLTALFIGAAVHPHH